MRLSFVEPRELPRRCRFFSKGVCYTKRPFHLARFEINDLYPTGYGGDLQLVIKEADGSEQQQVIPYAASSNLLRSGTNHYSVTLGKLRKDQVESEPAFGELTWRRGLNNFYRLRRSSGQ